MRSFREHKETQSWSWGKQWEWDRENFCAHTNTKFIGDVNCWVSTQSHRLGIKNLDYRAPPTFLVTWHQYRCRMKLQHVYYKPRNTRWDATTLVLLDMTAPPVMETFCKHHHRMRGNGSRQWSCKWQWLKTFTLTLSCTDLHTHTHSHTYILTPQSRVLLEKLPGFLASQDIPTILWNLKLITVFTQTHTQNIKCHKLLYTKPNNS